MFGVGGSEMVFVFVIVFLLFGSKKLPDIARILGKASREFRKARSEITGYINEAQYSINREVNDVTSQIGTGATSPTHDESAQDPYADTDYNDEYDEYYGYPEYDENGELISGEPQGIEAAIIGDPDQDDEGADMTIGAADATGSSDSPNVAENAPAEDAVPGIAGNGDGSPTGNAPPSLAAPDSEPASSPEVANPADAGQEDGATPERPSASV